MTDVTFFMIVTPRDVVIADFAVHSYARVRGVDFKLQIHSNYLLPEQKAYYFPRWERLPYVDLRRNDHHDADLEGIKVRVVDDKLEGPFEYCDPIWDRELPKIESPLVAQVDADFEIFNPRFLYFILNEMRTRGEKLIAYSCGYSPISVMHESFSGNNIILNERNHTWFCVYRREAFQATDVSHAFHREILPPTVSIQRNCWDSSGYFQKSLRDKGYEIDWLRGRFAHDYIHYGGFSKNTSVTRKTVQAFRLFARLEDRLPHRGRQLLRAIRNRAVPGLENDRNQWVREAPIVW